MKSIVSIIAAAAIVAVSLPAVTSSATAQTQIDPKREAALKDCTAQVKKRVSSRSDDQNARVAAFKTCMVDRGQAP
jgi:invasion protein IalB